MKEKKYCYEAIDKRTRQVMLQIESDNPAYIMRRRRKEGFSKDGCIYEWLFNCRETINGVLEWEYDSRTNSFIF